MRTLKLKRCLASSMLLIACAIASGCDTNESGSQKGGTITPNVTNAEATAATALQQALSQDDIDRLPGVHIGQASSANLTSLKYFIKSIEICESLTPTGSGFTNPTGCLTLYQSQSTPDYNTFGNAEARANTTDYIDLMNPTDLAKLRQPITLTADDARSYAYGNITWYQPVKVKATIPYIDGSGSLYTKDGNYNASTNNNEATALSTAPAQESVVRLSNGGNWFRFQNPFVITEADITDGTNFTIDLVFNPHKIVSGYSSTTRTGVLTDPVTSEGIYVPLLDLSPIPRRADQTSVRESYLIHRGAGTSTGFDLRLELYYIQQDTTKSIYGADLKGLMIAGSTSEAMAQKISFIEATGSTLAFKDYAQKAMISGFTRLTTTGQTGSAVLECNGSLAVLTETGCTSGTVAVTYELVSTAALP